jgi:two component transcriptional regulator, winged helix family
MRILIVEDEFNLADVIRKSLEKEKYVIDISGDGEDASYNIRSNIYDLVILDVMLPGMDGFEILKKMREEEIASKVIMLTAKSTLDDKLEGLQNGANDYITKPFHIEELVARVNIQLNSFSSKKVKGNIVVDSISTLEFSLKNSSSYEGTINKDKTAKSIKLTLDKSYKIKLTVDSYVTSLTDEDTTYSNIDFNGYKLYVNGNAIN